MVTFALFVSCLVTSVAFVFLDAVVRTSVVAACDEWADGGAAWSSLELWTLT